MSEIYELSGPEGRARRFRPSHPRSVFFDRNELNKILSVYSRKVISGEWCDYGFEDGRDEVAFAVFGRSGVLPAYRIVKSRRGRTDWRYQVVAAGGRVLRMGSDLAETLGVLDIRHLKLI